MSPHSDARLILDEIFSPSLAEAMRNLGYDVVAVAEQLNLWAMTDDEIFGWATGVLSRALPPGAPVTGILFTSSRTFPRSRKNPGPILGALHRWLEIGPPAPPITQDWLLLPDR